MKSIDHDLLPEREGQADCISVTGDDSTSKAAIGNWYSPAAVKKLLALRILEVLATIIDAEEEGADADANVYSETCKTRLQ